MYAVNNNYIYMLVKLKEGVEYYNRDESLR